MLALVIEHLNEIDARNLVVEPYLNGRENGFAVYFYLRKREIDGMDHRTCDRKLAFSGQRGTDSYVVYEGQTHEFQMIGNGLTDKIYRSAKPFDYDQADAAAVYIVERLTQLKEFDEA